MSPNDIKTRSFTLPGLHLVTVARGVRCRNPPRRVGGMSLKHFKFREPQKSVFFFSFWLKARQRSYSNIFRCLFAHTINTMHDACDI